MPNRTDAGCSNGMPIVEIKSKFDAEFRRFSVDRQQMQQFVEFYKLICRLHKLDDCETTIAYSDRDGDLLPINNDSNLAHALARAGTSGALLRLVVQRKGENTFNLHPGGRGVMPLFGKLMPPKSQNRSRVDIGEPVSFRPVSAIIDVDLVPATHMRVKLMKNGSDRPLGFYIRDGVSLRVTPTGVEKVPGIFISRLVPGGLAQHTGLLSVGDEVLEVNGIDVGDKTLDQVTDMMIANANNLIITVKPANQQLTLAAGRRNGAKAKSNKLPNAASAPNNQQFQSAAVASNSGKTGSTGDLRQQQQQQHQQSHHNQPQQKLSPDIPSHGSPSHSANSSQSGTTAKAETSGSGVVVVEDSDSSDSSDLEADEVHVHEPYDDSPAKPTIPVAPSRSPPTSNNHNIDIAAVEHHHQSDVATTSSHDSDEENASEHGNEHYSGSPPHESSSSTSNLTDSKIPSKDSVLRI